MRLKKKILQECSEIDYMLYRSEYWAVDRNKEHIMTIAKIGILRWMREGKDKMVENRHR